MTAEEDSLAILFADIVGSSHLYDHLGDEAARKMVADAIQLLTDIVTQYGGTRIKTIGDEIMATFPGADAGVQAAIFMQKVLEQTALNESLPVGTLHIKVGVNFGHVIREHGDVFGNAVNIAARVVAQAKSQQILTTKFTLDALASPDIIESRLIDKAALKGIEGLVELHEIIVQEDGTDSVTANVNDAILEHLIVPSTLTLRGGGKEIVLGAGKRSASLGRHAENDMILTGDGVSRLHARVEFNRNKFTLKDQSINGTFVVNADGNVTAVHRDEFILDGEGVIYLGRQTDPSATNAVSFKRSGS